MLHEVLAKAFSKRPVINIEQVGKPVVFLFQQAIQQHFKLFRGRGLGQIQLRSCGHTAAQECVGGVCQVSIPDSSSHPLCPQCQTGTAQRRCLPRGARPTLPSLRGARPRPAPSYAYLASKLCLGQFKIPAEGGSSAQICGSVTSSMPATPARLGLFRCNTVFAHGADD